MWKEVTSLSPYVYRKISFANERKSMLNVSNMYDAVISLKET